jgi:hypothetical protein
MTANRSEYTAGLRALADIIDGDPDLPLPYVGNSIESSIFAHSREELAAWARAIGGRLDKTVDEDSDSFGFELHGSIRGYRVVLYGDRNEVCTRRVVATREVTEEVPDPDALAAVPTITVTKTIEDVAWDCHPMLAESVSA